jgi:hypothetical protein
MRYLFEVETGNRLLFSESLAGSVMRARRTRFSSQTAFDQMADGVLPGIVQYTEKAIVVFSIRRTKAT